MNEQLDAELRGALNERAAAVPGELIERLGSADYHPRTTWLRPPVAAAGLAGLAGVAGVAIAAVGLGAGTQAAFAGWTAKPVRGTAAEIGAAESSCQSKLPAPPPGTKLPSGEWTTVLTDTRGPFTVVMLENSGLTASCFTGPSFVAVSLAGSGHPGFSVNAQRAPAPGQTSHGSAYNGAAGSGSYSVHVLTGPDGKPYSLIEGKLEAGVTSATVELQDGTEVEATVENGRFAAWWPAETRATDLKLTSASGVRTQELSGPRNGEHAGESEEGEGPPPPHAG